MTDFSKILDKAKELEAKMKRIYDENAALIEGEYTLGKEE